MIYDAVLFSAVFRFCSCWSSTKIRTFS